MKISWLGHASFLIETSDQIIITDPFNEEVGYPIYEGEVDCVTVSHDHWDHNAVHLLKGKPQVIKTAGEHEVNKIKFQGIKSYHDPEEGKLRGENIIFKISAEGIDVVHLGDLGHLLTDEHLDLLANVDILLIPVGGTFTVDAEEALTIVKQLNPKIVIPMHFSTPHLSFDLAPVEDFTKFFDIVTKKPYLEIKEGNLAGENKILVLDYLS
ncbi:MAG TPA: MBL fold metallo-hydrolase [Syntrophomonadaceae bacterium]|nr:MBL fold metallo-hydrolase [Syntrophomonadaceae bacterium]